MSEVISVIKAICALSDKDKDRLLECLYCPFYEECEETIENPMDNNDGSCMTKQQFIQKLKGCDNDD